MSEKLIVTIETFCIALLLAFAGIVFDNVEAATDGAAHGAGMAVNDPDQFAWHLFAAVNRPLGAATRRCGRPGPSNPWSMKILAKNRNGPVPARRLLRSTDHASSIS